MELKWNIGDCFVVIVAKSPFYGKKDFCYKILDVDNSQNFLYYEKSEAINLNKLEVRKAFDAEIQHYNSIGKPFHISEIKQLYYEIY